MAPFNRPGLYRTISLVSCKTASSGWRRTAWLHSLEADKKSCRFSISIWMKRRQTQPRLVSSVLNKTGRINFICRRALPERPRDCRFYETLRSRCKTYFEKHGSKAGPVWGSIYIIHMLALWVTAYNALIGGVSLDEDCQAT